MGLEGVVLAWMIPNALSGYETLTFHSISNLSFLLTFLHSIFSSLSLCLSCHVWNVDGKKRSGP